MKLLDLRHLSFWGRLRTKSQMEGGAFGQFIFDNADFNVNTLDGLGTFHVMGGIMVATPCDGIRSGKEIVLRMTKCSATDIISKTGSMQLKTYHRPKKEGLKFMVITDIYNLNVLIKYCHISLMLLGFTESGRKFVQYRVGMGLWSRQQVVNTMKLQK